MIPHHRLTIVRNRYRARELQVFRDLVESYFERSERDPDDVAMDWEGAQAARSRINQMLPRVLQIVRAAGIGEAPASGLTTDPGLALGRVEVLQRIFTARYGDGVDQEIFDVLDMARGVYDGDRVMALVRTVNPLHYAATAIAFLARGPRWLFGVLGLRRARRVSRIAEPDLARLEALASRLADTEDLIESRFAALQDRQARRQAEQAQQLAELAERLDFAERVLARRPPPDRLAAPSEDDIITPV